MWLSKKDKGDLRAIEKYLNAITTLDARFLQVTSLGDFAEGRLSMSRPGRLRIDYDDPNPVLIVANHGTIKYVDRELDQVSYFPLDETPAGLLLSERVRLLSDDILITAIERNAAAIRVSLRRAEDPRQGEITLSFSTKPLKLMKWDVVDARGLLTAVALQGARFGLPLKDDLFDYDAPETVDPRS